MKIKQRKISTLIDAEYNPRKISDDQLKHLTDSIKRFGFVDPVIINTHPDRRNIVVGGHQRLKAAKELGITEIPTVEVKLTRDKERELNIRLNKNTGSWDEGLLQEYFDFEELKGWGFDDAELNFDSVEVEGEIEDNEVPEPPESNIKAGDLFQLGEHRLLCGDATNELDCERLMRGQKSDMVFTDPPYGVDYGEKNRFLNSFQKAGRNLKDIQNDILGRDELFDMLVAGFSNLYEFSNNECSYYVTAPQGGELGMMMMMMMMMTAKLPVRHVLIWNKNTQGFSLGRLDYEYKHEPILYTWKKSHKFYGKGEFKNSVWEYDKPRQSKEHPTMKPVELIINAIKNSSTSGQIVADWFGGSGSTLIACEKTKRKCCMMEVDPHYCAVIIERWEKFTDNKAKKLN